MSKALYYSPRIKRFLVTVLYHEARLHEVPMTVLANQLLERTLQGTQGWHQATVQANQDQQTS